MMRNLSLFLVLFLAIGFTACEKDKCDQTWTQLATVPVTLNRAAVQDSVEAQAPREFCTGGGIYAFGDYLFVNVYRQGYHLMDNSDPSNPTNVAFLQIPGATQMAFVNGRMVTDSYADLLVMELVSTTELRLISSTENFLLETVGFEVPEGQIAIGFEEREVTFTQACDGSVTGNWGRGIDFFAGDFAVNSTSGGFGGGSNPQINTAGSLSRMAFCDNNLYVLGTMQLSTYELRSDELVNVNNTQTAWGQETIIRRGDYLYVASTSALTIYDIGGCGEPRQLGTAPHFWSNDPVAVEGDRAVVTLRWGNPEDQTNGGNAIVYDISDRTNPVELARLIMSFPIGVQLYEGKLYICDGVDGLRVFDFAGGTPQSLLSREIQRFEGTSAIDAIVLPYTAGTVVMTIGEDNLTQYSSASNGSLTQLVQLQVDNCNLD